MIDLVGGSVVFVDHLRLNAQIRAAVDASGGALPSFETWWSSAGSVGFGLLIIGIHLGAFALYLERREVSAKRRQTA